jgi:hypothetical protein
METRGSDLTISIRAPGFEVSLQNALKPACAGSMDEMNRGTTVSSGRLKFNDPLIALAGFCDFKLQFLLDVQLPPLYSIGL